MSGRSVASLGRALGLVAAGGLAAASGACGPSRARMLQGEIAQAVQTSPGHVDLASLFPARWDRVCILVPGVGRDEVKRLLGFDYAAGPYLVSRDDVAGVLFVRGGDVVTAVRYPRADADFTAVGRSYCLPRAGAVFRATAAPGAGGRRLLLPTQPPAAR